MTTVKGFGGADLPLEALVTATELAVEYLPTLITERRVIVRMSMRPTSVLEIGAALRLPAGVARVLVSDLAGAGLPGSPAYSEDAVREALALPSGCPLWRMDARASRSSLDTLVTLVEHALVRGTDRALGRDRIPGPIVHK